MPIWPLGPCRVVGAVLSGGSRRSHGSHSSDTVPVDPKDLSHAGAPTGGHSSDMNPAEVMEVS